MIAALNQAIQVYSLPLNPAPGFSPLDSLPQILSLDEIERRDRYRHEQARLSFVRVRIALRLLLARYLQRTPAEIRLEMSDKGKPLLAGPESSLGLNFNVSHSGDWGLLAFGLNADVGVDVEQHRASIQQRGIAQRCFSPAEFEWWASLPQAERTAGFYRFWCCKEAFAKATGLGLGIGLENIALDFSPTACLRSIPPGHGEVGDWHLLELTVAGPHQAALCYRAERRDVRLFNALDFIP